MLSTPFIPMQYFSTWVLFAPSLNTFLSLIISLSFLDRNTTTINDSLTSHTNHVFGSILGHVF